MKMSEVNINELKCKHLILKIDRVAARLSVASQRSDYVELVKDGTTYIYKNWKKASEATGVPVPTMFKVRHGEYKVSAKGMRGYIIPDKYIVTKRAEHKYILELNGVKEKFSTQQEAAEHYKVSQSTIGDVIKGKERKGIRVVN